MDKALVVLWESHRNGIINTVTVADNVKQARMIARGLSDSRNRRTDIIPLTGKLLKEMVSVEIPQEH